MQRTFQLAIPMIVLLALGCRQKEGFYIKSFDSQSDKIVLIRSKTNTTIVASCLSTRDMKENPKDPDALGSQLDKVCLNLPGHVGETIREGRKEGEIDKTIAIYFHLDDSENTTEIWSVDSETTE